MAEIKSAGDPEFGALTWTLPSNTATTIFDTSLAIKRVAVTEVLGMFRGLLGLTLLSEKPGETFLELTSLLAEFGDRVRTRALMSLRLPNERGN